MATGAPLVGIAYHPKTREFMRQFGCEEYCIDDDKLTSEALISTFDKLMTEVDTVGPRLYARAKEMSETVKVDMKAIIKK